MDIATKMRRDWDRRCREHAYFWIANDDHQSDERFATSGEETAQSLVAQLPSHTRPDWPTWRVLEIGCGIGRVLRPLARRFGHVCGVDVSPQMIERSRAWLGGLPNVETRAGSGIDLAGWPDAHFDLVYSYVASQHMPRSVFASYLRESSRVLRPGACLLLQCCVGERNDLPLADTLTLRYYPADELDALLETSGFRSEPGMRQRAQSGTHPSLWWLARRVDTSRPEVDTHWRQTACTDDPTPLDVSLRMTLAHTHLRAHRPDAAIDVLSALVTHDPTHLPARLLLISLLLQANRAQPALTHLEHLLHHHPDFEPAHNTLHRLRTHLHASP